MSTSRDRRRRRRRIAAAVVAVTLFAGWAFLRWTSMEEAVEPGPRAGARPPSATPSTPTASPSSSGGPRAGAKPAGFGSATALTGLPGGSQTSTIGEHTVVMRAWSSKPLAFAAWYVPTREGQKKGATRLPGPSWQMRATAYGPPDYAQVYLQADGTGTPVFCEVRVDGEVTARERSKGPYGFVMCQG